jgi:urease accessory protein
MAWHAHLQLDYTQAALGAAPEPAFASPVAAPLRTVARHTHTGPLRILQSLYPEGDTVCHNVLVHPPGGLVGGDVLELDVQASGQAHGLITTPGASRFYRSAGELALQDTRIQLRDAARLEWLPAEAIYYDACQAENRLRIELAPDASLMGWDVAALGLPHAGLPFASGTVLRTSKFPASGWSAAA